MVHFLADVTSTVSVGFDYFETPAANVLQSIDFADESEVDDRTLRMQNVNRRLQGYRTNSATLPPRIRWQSARKETPDILPGFVVSERFKLLVDEYEPGIHQFVPVEVWRDKQGLRIETYYWFIVCKRLDSVNRNLTTFRFNEGSQYWVKEILDTETRDWVSIPDAKLVFDRGLIGSRHIWCDPHVISIGYRLCSNAFAEEAMSRDFIGLGCSKWDEY